MLDSAGLLLRERGVAGVTVDAVLAHSGAPRGSVYHHFPGGRNELVLAALAQSGDLVSGMLERAVARGDARDAVAVFIRFWKRTLTDSQFRAGCPVVAAAVDSRRDVPGVAETVRATLDRWHASLTELLVADGYPPARAERLARLVMSAIEGAVILSRAEGDLTPLDDVAAELDQLLEQR
jgi:TetR/AcrR family transcriptional regulator, lmrAB and yxaGH operons repressor